MTHSYDAVVVGAGPNGLAAAVVLAEAGRSVLVVEAKDTIGGGCRTAELTLPGYHHDICAAIHPMGVVSPLLRRLPLAAHGLEWVQAPAPLAHPFDDGTAAVLHRSIAATAETLGGDGEAWARLMQPYAARADAFFSEILRPIRIPRHPLLMARFGATGLRSCRSLVRSHFEGRNARALFAGCAAHSFVSLDATASASFGMVLALVGHVVDWPCAKGGSQQIVDSLASYLRALGGRIEVGREVRSMDDLPATRAVLFDLPPVALARIAGTALPDSYRRQLLAFRHGPGVFKLDWALSGPIPWTAPECHRAATVHLGNTFEEVAASEAAAVNGRICERPFVLVAQQSLFDVTRAPAGHHTGWAYCHVPNGSTVDRTDHIENQIERFAPGFRDLILARHVMPPAAMHQHNANMIGGDIGGGANDFGQFMFRPTRRWNPYTTPNPRLFLCSSSTPPGGGVHGMCGYWAATAALKGVLEHR
ncbi:MAG TPA: NAD(P)/FAD-dependent oxidoreductase [Vicinamibacterales bacterium]|nr:NAD(P)/FAD-dependent oxidoreductase [Vicinamibacterales bacterium]